MLLQQAPGVEQRHRQRLSEHVARQWPCTAWNRGRQGHQHGGGDGAGDDVGHAEHGGFPQKNCLRAAHERVVPPLVAEGAAGAVAGHEGGVVAQGPQALRDAVDQLRVAALRKVRAAHAARKQHIAHEGQPRIGRMKDDVAGRVAGAVAHRQRAAARLYLPAR